MYLLLNTNELQMGGAPEVSVDSYGSEVIQLLVFICSEKALFDFQIIVGCWNLAPDITVWRTD